MALCFTNKFQLDPTNPEGELGAKIKQAKALVEQSRSALKQSRDASNNIQKSLSELNEVRKDLRTRFDKLNAYHASLQYFKVVEQLEKLW